MTLIPRRRHSSASRGSSAPSAVENTGGRSSRMTATHASTRSGARPGRVAVFGMPSRSRKRSSIAWTPRSVSSVTVAGSIGGRSALCSQRFTPNGRSVSPRTPRIIFRRSSGGTLSPARMPRPPARHTSATSSGPATPPIPDWTIGYSIASSSQSAVRNMLTPPFPAPARGWPALGACRAGPCRRAGRAYAARP